MLYTFYMWFLLVAATLFWAGLLALLIPAARKGPLYQFITRSWARMIVRASGTPLEISGLSKLDPDSPYVFMSNHQSYFDVIGLAGYLPRPVRFVAKKELVYVPLFGQVMWATGHIIINRARHDSAVDELKKAAAKIAGGTSILVFPEGTRSPDHRLGEFKKGGFMLALAAKVPVVPISIAGTQPMMPKNRWTFARTRVHIVIGDPIPTADLIPEDRDRLMAMTRDAIIRNFPPGSPEFDANKQELTRK